MSRSGWHRRQWLQWALACATGALALPARAVRLRGNPFASGVASGAPSADGVVLWTRLDPQAWQEGSTDAVAVHWELCEHEHFAQGVRSGQALATAALGWSVHVQPQHLESGRWYFYRFRVGEAWSPTGRTRTLPAPEAAVQRLRLVYASCQRWEDGYFAAWRHARQESPDLVLFLGDYIYEYPGTHSRVRVPPGGWVYTLEQYRARYALYKSDPDLQAMHAACPWLCTWDDHEVQNDYAGEHPGDGEPPGGWERYSFAQRRAAAYQAYYENMPLPASVLVRSLQSLEQSAPLCLHADVAWGRLAHLLLLDTRQYKDRQACTKGGRRGSGLVEPRYCPVWDDPARSMLGREQEAWLEQALAQGVAARMPWTVLAQSTLLGARNVGSEDKPRYWNDGWDGYPAARARLTQALQRHRVPNPVVLGGDVHENWVGHVLADYADPNSAVLGVEFCGTSISSHSGKADHTAALLERNKHFVFADSLRRGYGVADFTEQELLVRLRTLDDVTRSDASVQTLATFGVPAGQHRLQRRS